jgi:hypothetical protein
MRHTTRLDYYATEQFVYKQLNHNFVDNMDDSYHTFFPKLASSQILAKC